jgi:predicted transcriptional regulator
MPGTSKTSAVVAVRLPNELRAELNKYAADRRWSISWAIVNLIEQGLERETKRPASKKQRAASAL